MKKIILLFLLFWAGVSSAQWVAQYDFGTGQVKGYTQNSVYALPYTDYSLIDTSKWRYEKEFSTNLYKWIINKVPISGIAPGKIKLPIYYNPDMERVAFKDKPNVFLDSNTFKDITVFTGDVHANKIYADSVYINIINEVTSLALKNVNNKIYGYFNSIDSSFIFGADTTLTIKNNNFDFSNKANINQLRLDSGYTTTGTIYPGTLSWNAVDGTIDAKMLNNSTLQIGQELYIYGKAVGNIQNGEVVQFAGAQGNHITIKKAVVSEVVANPEYIVGIATQNITNGDFGYVTWFGKINGVYTPNWTEGEVLYLSNTTGQLTDTIPAEGQTKVIMAAVIKAATGGAENGVFMVRPTHHYNGNTFKNLFADTIQVVKRILPTTNKTVDLGTSSLYWRNGYIGNIYSDTIKKSMTADSILTVATYKQKSVVAIADSVVNCNLSNTFSKTLSANQRFVISNIGDGQTINIAVTNTASNYTVLWVTPTDGLDVKWADGIQPTQTTGAKSDIWTFIRIGNTIFGNVTQNF